MASEVEVAMGYGVGRGYRSGNGMALDLEKKLALVEAVALEKELAGGEVQVHGNTKV
ncbi:hypothetical protein YC2023_038854 [Brassica napus]